MKRIMSGRIALVASARSAVAAPAAGTAIGWASSTARRRAAPYTKPAVPATRWRLGDQCRGRAPRRSSARDPLRSSADLAFSRGARRIPKEKVDFLTSSSTARASRLRGRQGAKTLLLVSIAKTRR